MDWNTYNFNNRFRACCRESQDSCGLKWCNSGQDTRAIVVESRRTLVDWNQSICYFTKIITIVESHRTLVDWNLTALFVWLTAVCRESQESRGYYNTTKKYISTDVFSLWYVKQCINLGGASPLWGLQRNRQLLAVNVADIWRERYITLSREVLSAKIRDTLVVTTNGKKHSK